MRQHHNYCLKQIRPDKVAFSDSNPRQESEDEIFKDETFERLKDSVYQFGVLVPIVVHEQVGNNEKPYRLVDGERRLRAALQTGVKNIPAHVARSDDPTDDLVQAVHIHMLRKQWSPVAQARAVKRIISERRRKEQNVSEKEVLEELQSLTGCTDTKLKSLRRAAKYPETVLSAVDRGEIVFSHLVQFEESFVEQLEKHYPTLFQTASRKAVREVLVEKARKKVLTSSRALMNNVVPIIARAKSAEEKQYVGKLLGEFITTKEMPAEEVLKVFERRFPEAQGDLLRASQEIIDQAESLMSRIEGFQANQLSSFPNEARRLDTCLTDLRSRISAKLKAIKSIVR